MWKKNNDGQSLPRVGKVASGASRIGFWRYEREGRLSQMRHYTRAPYPPLTRSPFPNGEGYDTRIPLFSHRQSEYTHMWKKNNDEQSLPRVGKVASEASRIGFWRNEREGEIISGRRFTKAPSTKQLIKPIYSYKKRKSNAANDFNVIYRSGCRLMQ